MLTISVLHYSLVTMVMDFNDGRTQNACKVFSIHDNMILNLKAAVIALMQS